MTGYKLRLKDCTLTDLPDGKVKVEGVCRVTKKPHHVIVPLSGLIAWEDKHIQQAMPELSPDDREFLISRTSPEGWTKIFGDDEE